MWNFPFLFLLNSFYGYPPPSCHCRNPTCTRHNIGYITKTKKHLTLLLEFPTITMNFRPKSTIKSFFQWFSFASVHPVMVTSRDHSLIVIHYFKSFPRCFCSFSLISHFYPKICDFEWLFHYYILSEFQTWRRARFP